MENEFQINSNGEFEFMGEQVRNQGKNKSPYELVYQPDGSFAMIARGKTPRQGEIVTAMSEDGFAF